MKFKAFWKPAFFLCLFLLEAHFAFAEAQAKEDLEFFLDSVGTFLIQIIGPGILVIGIAIAGVSMALGNEQGMRRGAIAAGGGALIMLARAILDLMKDVTRF
ncbi:MAG: TrbC/VirB2 family protein [Candidatus Omnitrophica bacterium]|nr:TrbC/VirB2 family protein [Candidatus Omnitrophota bacterium]